MSINNALWIQIYAIITLCFCGVVQYFTGILAVLWLPVIMAFVTTGMLLMQTQRTPLALDLSEMMVLVIYLCFLVLALISTFLRCAAKMRNGTRWLAPLAATQWAAATRR